MSEPERLSTSQATAGVGTPTQDEALDHLRSAMTGQPGATFQKIANPSSSPVMPALNTVGNSVWPSGI